MYKLDKQKLDILQLGRYLFIYSVVSVNRNIVRYKKYLLVVTVVVVFVSYCYSYCDFLRTFYISCRCVQVQVRVPYLFYFQRKSLIVLGLFHYKYCGEYLSRGRLQWERTVVESLNFLTLWAYHSAGEYTAHARRPTVHPSESRGGDSLPLKPKKLDVARHLTYLYIPITRPTANR